MKPRIFISTDIGRDPDDEQSLIHALHMLPRYDLRGISLCWPGGNRDKVTDILNAYQKDWMYRLPHGYPSPQDIRRVVFNGCKERKGLGQRPNGVQRLIEEAQGREVLHVLVWGAATDLANAIQASPNIKTNIRAFCIGSWNREQDKESWAYLMEQTDLKWIACESSFRGIYAGWPLAENRAWVREHVKPAGALGKLFCEISDTHVGSGAIKMGDTPSLLWALTGEAEDLSKGTQGGKYKRVKGTWRYEDLKSEAQAIGSYKGAKTVASRRKAFLSDWNQVLINLKGQP